jgi:hypothetical protein
MSSVPSYGSSDVRAHDRCERIGGPKFTNWGGLESNWLVGTREITLH